MWFCGGLEAGALHPSLETLPEHAPGPSVTHQVLLFVSDGPHVMPHKAHGEKEVDDGEDSVQPKEVIAKEDITRHQGWAPQQKGCRAGTGLPPWGLCREPMALPPTEAAWSLPPRQPGKTLERSLFLHGALSLLQN